MIGSTEQRAFAPKIRTRLKIHSGLPDFTAFIGLFYVLLLLFDLCSSYIQVTGISVELPETKVKGTFGIRKIVTVIDARGKIFFHDKELADIEAFRTELASVVNASRERVTMLLSSDKNASFGVTAQVMAVAESLNVNLIILTAQPAEKDEKRLLPEQIVE